MFEGILGMMKNWGEKSGERVFLVDVWLEKEEGKKKKWWGLGVFFPNPPNVFSPKWGEQWREN